MKELGQLFHIGLSGPELTSEEAKFIVDNNIGGITLFDRNLETLSSDAAKASEIAHAISYEISERESR